MSDQGGSSPAGWQPDPFGRHEYRYWDGAAWSDQVSDGGVVSTDPPVQAPAPATTTAPTPTPMPMGAPLATPTAGGSKRAIPVGMLALVGVAVAAIVAALFIFVFSGDDDGGGTGDFAGTISEDEPFVVRTFDLEAGQVVRALVTPEDDFDPLITLAIGRDIIATPLLASLSGAVAEDELNDAVDNEDSDYYDELLSGYDDLLTDGVPSEVLDTLTDDLSGDFGGLQDTLSDELPVLAEAGIPAGTQDSNGEGEPEGQVFLAPLSGTYSVIVSGRGSEGDFEGSIEVEGPADDFDEFDAGEALDLQAYYTAFDEHRDFLCDEDFWGDDPTAVFDDAELLCDEDNFNEFLTDTLGDFSDTLTSDFSDTLTSDFSDDFTSDFSDFSDDFSSDFTDDIGNEEFIGPIEVGDSATGFIEPNGSDVYEIDGTGGPVVIRIRGTFAEGGLDPTVAVRDSTGTQIGFDDDGGARDRDSRLEVTLETGETYQIVVAGFSDYSGDYTIRVR